MPHVIVKAWTGKSEEQKQRLSEAIARDVMQHLDCGADAVSVSIEEIPPERWKAQVYLPDIQDGPGTLYKKPGYDM